MRGKIRQLSSHGRGGAGNIVVEDEIPANEQQSPVSVSKSATFSTGRGGAGNRANSSTLGSEEANTVRVMMNGGTASHTTQTTQGGTGRGGAGNILAARRLSATNSGRDPETLSRCQSGGSAVTSASSSRSSAHSGEDRSGYLARRMSAGEIPPSYNSSVRQPPSSSSGLAENGKQWLWKKFGHS